MKLIKVAAAELNQTPLDWDGNARRIAQAIAAARAEEVNLLCLPELCVTGYGCEDAFHSPGVQRTARRLLLDLLPETRGMIVSFGLPLLHGGGLFNTACLAADGELLGFVGKQNLAGEGIHYEPRWFKPWPAEVRVDVEIEGRDYPLGDLLFELGGVRIGFEICEDAWVAHRPGAELSRDGVDLILNPSASHFAFGKQEVRRRFVLEGSRAFTVGYVYANLLGNEAGRAVYDGGAMIAAAGKLLAAGPRFSFQEVLLTAAVLDVESLRMARARTGSFRIDWQEGNSARVIRRPFAWPGRLPAPAAAETESWELGRHVKEEEFTRAVALALFDYLRKSRSRGFVVSLSGGADSSAVALLCSLAVRMARRELGGAEFARRLSHDPEMAELSAVEDILPRLLTTVYQATRNSGEVTANAARDVAEAVGSRHFEFDVDSLVQDYISIVEQAIDRPLTWERDDLPLQNVQARVRSPGVWLLANIFGALLLATSNRSEAAVGYATMDGDTSGGLSPIAGIDKAFLRHWLRWMETEGPAGWGPVPALRAVNDQQPTAELRPPGALQTDEKDLMPYELLDAIERAAIRDKLTPLEVFQTMRPEHPQYPPRQLALWVERFFQLWCRNQWKRERYAPSFHLDDENLDPKTWCRFPILSGGFERELAELAEYVAGLDEVSE